MELIGNLTTDPVMKTVSVGEVPTLVTNFSMAVNERGRKDAGGKLIPTYFRCHAWREMAKICAENLRKGRKVYITGPVRLNSYKDSSGAVRSALDIRVDTIEFLDAKPADLHSEDVSDIETISDDDYFPCA